MTHILNVNLPVVGNLGKAEALRVEILAIKFLDCLKLPQEFLRLSRGEFVVPNFEIFDFQRNFATRDRGTDFEEPKEPYDDLGLFERLNDELRLVDLELLLDGKSFSESLKFFPFSVLEI